MSLSKVNVEIYCQNIQQWRLNSIKGEFQLNFRREKIIRSQLRAVFLESKNSSNLMPRFYNLEQNVQAFWILSLGLRMYLTSVFGFSGLGWAVSFFLGNHISDTLLPIFAVNRARVNNFPGAYGTTNRKTMSADRSIEGDGKLNWNFPLMLYFK